MIEKVSKAAEKLAINVSRRAFLGRLGKGALGAAGVLAGVLAFPAIARAGGGSCYGRGVYCHACNCCITRGPCTKQSVGSAPYP